MKVGDKFVNYGTTYQLVKFGFHSNKVTVLNESDNTVLNNLNAQVRNLEDITKEEFNQILKNNPDNDLKHCKTIDGKELFPEPVYCYGNKFVIVSSNHQNTVGNILALCQVDSSVCTLISLETCNRFSDTVKVESPCNVTESELQKMLGRNLGNTVIKKLDK